MQFDHNIQKNQTLLSISGKRALRCSIRSDTCSWEAKKWLFEEAEAAAEDDLGEENRTGEEDDGDDDEEE